MVDEMDLLSSLKGTDPVRPRAFDEARAVLRAAMAVDGMPEPKSAQRRRWARWGMRRTAGFGAATLGAAAAAVALVVTSASAPRPPRGGNRRALHGGDGGEPDPRPAGREHHAPAGQDDGRRDAGDPQPVADQ